ncbi:MAG TPA: ribose-5-phosphate isomerase RpiA [Rhizomicrobium sp.]|jgi:ribose 5-phosphate isomerase A|nr:ribose-5-phosphate isomerase RpiA [Rhizomicrobium sp.]
MRLIVNEQLKRAAAAGALEFVESGMKLGLGTGTTAEIFLELLADRVRSGLTVMGAATSERTEAKARALGIPCGALDALAPLDLDIDGADEADRGFNLIKGGGGALLREKIVAASSKRMIVIMDDSKLVDCLGRFPLPVEVTPFGHETTAARIREAAARGGYRDIPVGLRERDGKAFVTDSGNLIYDCAFGAIQDAPVLASLLGAVPGVVEHGLFIGLASTLIVASEAGLEVIGN